MVSKKKIRLGKQAGRGYKYSTSLDLGKNLLEQAESLIEEETIREALKKRIEGICKSASKVKRKKGSLSYYFKIGKALQFAERNPFDGAEPHSLFRVIHELCPEILPHISNPKVATKHVAAMFYLGKIGKADLHKASWSQWYEITKFKKLFGKDKGYRKILGLLEEMKLSGPELRRLIKENI